ncbi:MAG: DUF6600 domain-containing protein [Panacibacter sp.]
MKAKFNNSLFTILSMSVLMACSSTRNATAQYPNNDDDTYGTYDDDDAYNDDKTNYNEPSESDVNINLFVNELSPYGRWVSSPSYGQAWIPYETGFTPYYTRGHWVYSNYGWTWASDYRWGWAPFHYGRWASDPFYGWMWVPGYQWGPAWVGWRTGGDYYGWAPLSPGINISLGFGFGYNYPANNWCFVPRRYIGYNNFNRYAVNRGRNVTIIRNTTIINNTNIYRNTRYATGPNRIEVERYTGRRINEVRVSNSSRPGPSRVTNNNTINIYRPQVNRNTDKRDEVKNDNRNNRVDAGRSPSLDNNTPNQNPRVIRTPERRNNNNDRKPDPRDRVNNNDNNDVNRNGNQPDVNRDRNNDLNKDRNNDINRNRNNDTRKNNDIRNRPPQQNDNRFPDNRNYNNGNDQQNRQNNNQRPPSYRNDRNNNDQNRNNNQRPDYNNGNRSNGRTLQPSQQQPQRNMPARPAPQQRDNSRKKPA